MILLQTPVIIAPLTSPNCVIYHLGSHVLVQTQLFMFGKSWHSFVLLLEDKFTYRNLETWRHNPSDNHGSSLYFTGNLNTMQILKNPKRTHSSCFHVFYVTLMITFYVTQIHIRQTPTILKKTHTVALEKLIST